MAGKAIKAYVILGKVLDLYHDSEVYGSCYKKGKNEQTLEYFERLPPKNIVLDLYWKWKGSLSAVQMYAQNTPPS